MNKVENAVLAALESGNMTMQKLFDSTPFHHIAVERIVDELATQGKIRVTIFQMNTQRSQMLELNH